MSKIPPRENSRNQNSTCRALAVQQYALRGYFLSGRIARLDRDGIRFLQNHTGMSRDELKAELHVLEAEGFIETDLLYSLPIARLAKRLREEAAA
jgi:hypothetical protein